MKGPVKALRIEIRDSQGKPRFSADVDPTNPVTVIQARDGVGPAITLNWDRALDDQHRLRHCPVCGCPDLYARRPMPRMIGFALLVAAALIALLVSGVFGNLLLAVAVFVLIVILDVLAMVLVPRALICYRCKTQFRGTPVRRNHPMWEPAVAERYPSSLLRYDETQGSSTARPLPSLSPSAHDSNAGFILGPKRSDASSSWAALDPGEEVSSQGSTGKLPKSKD